MNGSSISSKEVTDPIDIELALDSRYWIVEMKYIPNQNKTYKRYPLSYLLFIALGFHGLQKSLVQLSGHGNGLFSGLANEPMTFQLLLTSRSPGDASKHGRVLWIQRGSLGIFQFRFCQGTK